MKRFFLAFLVLVLFTGTAAAEDAEVLTSGDYLYTILADGTVCVNHYSGVSSELTIPAEIDGKTVTAIGDEAFVGREDLTAITIPDSIRKVGTNPFRGSLAAIRVSPEHSFLEVIDGVLFEKETKRLISCSYASNLSEYAIPQGTRQIGKQAFSGCTLTAVTIPDSVTTIEDQAFAWCYSLTSITIPDSVQEVGANPFVYTPASIQVSPEHPCLEVLDGVLFEKESKRLISYPHGCSLSEYAIPQGIRQIGDDAFSGSTLTSVTIPDSVTAIGSGAFSTCRSLRAVTIPDGVTAIEDLTFAGCDSLTEITIPDSVTSIGVGAFGSRSLTEITIPDSVTSIGDAAFSGCSSLTAITIPDGISSIGDLLFYDCGSLTSVTIPDSVTSIGEWAFRNCGSLTAITIPDSVTAIGVSAFDGCDILTLTVGQGTCAEQYCKDNNLLYQYTN